MKTLNKILGIFTILSFGFLVLTSMVSALSMPPMVSIGANPTADTTSLIQATAVDLGHTGGIAWIKIYEDYNLVKECDNTVVCAYTAVHTTPGVRGYYAQASDKNGITSSSQYILVTFQNGIPTLNGIGDKSVNSGSLLTFAIDARDSSLFGNSLVYSASGLPSGATFDSIKKIFSWTPSSSQVGVYYVNFSVTNGISSDSEVVKITVNSINPNPSGNCNNTILSNIVSTPSSPANYSPSQVYQFNATWANSSSCNIGSSSWFGPWGPWVGNNNHFIPTSSSVWIEFDGVNYTVSGNSDVYSFNRIGLSAGTHNYTWFTRDATGNVNKSATFSYIVNKAVTTLGLNMLPSNAVVNGTQTNVSGNNCPSGFTCNLYRNGVLVSNPDVGTFGIGVYNYIYNMTGNANYADASISGILNVYATGSNPNDNGNGGGNGGSSSGVTKTVGDSELTSGFDTYLYLNDKLKFYLCGSPYYIKLTDFDSANNKASFRLTPGSNFNLKEGDNIQFDLNSDGTNDVLFRLENVGSNRVQVYIKGSVDSCNSAVANPVVPIVNSNPITGDTISTTKTSSSAMAWIITFLVIGVVLMLILIILLLKGKR